MAVEPCRVMAGKKAQTNFLFDVAEQNKPCRDKTQRRKYNLALRLLRMREDAVPKTKMQRKIFLRAMREKYKKELVGSMGPRIIQILFSGKTISAQID